MINARPTPPKIVLADGFEDGRGDFAPARVRRLDLVGVIALFAADETPIGEQERCAP